MTKASSNQDVFVKVTEYNGHVVIQTLLDAPHKDFVPQDDKHFGCVLMDTKAHLGMSKEAHEALKTIERSGDDLGDVDAWKCTDGRWCFSWIGGLQRIVWPDKSEGSRHYSPHDLPFRKIPNSTDAEAKRAIDSMKEQACSSSQK